jgi:hypothetical protein
VNEALRIPLDTVLVALALVGAIAFVLFDRPKLHVGLMLFVASVWGAELAIVVSHAPAAPALYERLHTPLSIATTIALLAIFVTRRPPPEQP